MQLCIDLSLVPGVQWYMVSYQSPLKMLEFMAWPILTVRNTWIAIFAAVVDGNVCPVERRISPVLHVSSLTTGLPSSHTLSCADSGAGTIQLRVAPVSHAGQSNIFHGIRQLTFAHAACEQSQVQVG